MKLFVKSIILILFSLSFIEGYAQPTITNIDITHVTVCKGDATGIIDITANGDAPFTYSILEVNGGIFQASNIFNGLNAGTYTVAVKDTYGTPSTNSLVIINEPPLLHIATEEKTDVTGCFGNNNGTITITANGGGGAIEYSIEEPANFGASGNFASLLAGNYTVRVKDANGCLKQGTVLEIQQPLEISMSAGANNVLGCHGDDNGSIEITASGGTSPLEYSIDNGTSWQNSKLFSMLAPANYQAIVKDAVGCPSPVVNLTITEPAQVVIDSETPIDVTTCNGESTGQITITASGGTPNLFYAINGIFQEDDGVFPNLFAGTYNVQVKDANQCTVNGSTLTIGQPSKIIIDSETKLDITTCFGDTTGTIDIVAHGGIPPLQYSVDNGANWQLSNSFLVSAGSYQTLVKDVNDCIVTGQSHIVSQPIKLTITDVDITDVTTCFGGNDGTIHIVTNAGGTPNYEFSIDGEINYFTEYDIDTLSARTFDLIIKDAHNCKDTFENITIGQPTQLIINDGATILKDPLCNGGTDGSIEVFASGGSEPIYYSSDGGTTFKNGSIISGLLANISYAIAVKDDHGCIVNGASYTLGQPAELVIDLISKQDVDDCFGGNNGSITITAHGGSPNIQYSINSEQDYQLSNTFLNLPASNNFIVIKDSHNCKVSGGNITITQPNAIHVTFQDFKNIEGCKSAEIGEIHIKADGGTDPILYSVDGINYLANNGDFLHLGAGLYNISVKDDNDCIANGDDIKILEPDTLIVSVLSSKDIDCFGNANGNISLKASGGEFRWYYSIDGGVNYQTSPFFSNLNAGNYQIYVKDSYDCVRSGITQTIIQPSELVINSVNFEDINNCFGDDDGTITINASGGVASYLYSINLGSSWQNNNGIYTNLTPKDYFIKVRDANLCEKTFLDINSDIDTITITEPTELKPISINKLDIKCYKDNNGTIEALGSGGTGNIKYSINNGLTYPNADNDGHFEPLLAGEYFVRMKDANDCETSSYPISIYEPDSLYISSVTFEDEKCLGEKDGIITIFGVGGTSPFSYSIDGVSYQSNRKIDNLAAGTYIPMLKDVNNCEASADPVTISSPVNPSLFSTDVSEGCSPLSVQFNRLNDGVTYLWEFDDGETSSYNEPIHIFNNSTNNSIDFTVTAYSLSPSNCKDTAEMIITVKPKPQLEFIVSPIVTYFPETTRNITNNSPSGYINYIWDFDDGQTSNEENPGSHIYETCGDYDISVYAENTFTCSDTAFKTIRILTHSPEALFAVDTTEHCVPFSFNFENQSFNADSVEWILDDGTIINDNSFSRYYDNDGVYKIRLNAFGFCNTQDSYEQIITVHKSPIVNFESVPDTVMLPNQPIHCYNRSSDDAESFFWEFGDGGTSTEENPFYQYTKEGSYYIKLTVLSENKCIDSLTLSSEVVVLPAGNLIFPTAFSPNSSGINKVFKPIIYNSVETFKMKIFNRWGELVFYTDDIEKGWTGFFSGKLSMQDTYVWRAEGKFLNGTPYEMAGSVTLLR